MRRALSLLTLLSAPALLSGLTLLSAPARAAGAPAAGPAAQRFGIRLAGVPANQARDPRAARYIVGYLPPGAVIRRSILIMNEERRWARFGVYPDAASIGRGLFLGGDGAERSALTGWVTVRHPVLTLPPRGSAADQVTIRVPRQVTRGEHYGVIWVQQVATVRAAPDLTVREVTRVGVRIYLAVGPGGAPPTRFAITGIAASRSASGSAALLVAVRDTGGRAVDVGGSVVLSGGPGGSRTGPLLASRVESLAPGQAGTLTFVLSSRLPPGRWQVTATLASGLVTRTARATVTLPGMPGPGARPGPILAATWLAALLIALTVIGLVSLRRWRQRHPAPA